METLVIERDDRLILMNRARVVRAVDDVTEDMAASVPDWSLEQANPYVKWIVGSYVEADNPNSNKQFWTKDDLELAEYTIKYAPLNMVHKVRQPVGFFVATKQVNLADKADAGGTMRIEALSGMWSHIFKFESALVDKADEEQSLFYSMECIGSHLICAGDQGCGEKFEYADHDNHCAHLKERSSVRHIVNPIFRGGALIIPPVKPGWKDANAGILEKALIEEARRYAEETESAYNSARADGANLSPAQWEAMMAVIVSGAE